MSSPRLLDVVMQLADESPEAVALWDTVPDSAPLPVTRHGLLERSCSVAALLRGLGVGPGDCVGVWLPNWSDAVAAQLAVLHLGAHVVGINTRYNTEEVTHVLDRAKPKALLIAHEFNGLDLVGTLRQALERTQTSAPNLLVVTAPGTAISGADVPDTTAYALGSRVRILLPTPASGPLTPGPEGLAVAFTTSGSTGRPKLAAHHERGTTEHLLAAGRAIAFREGDAMLGALPLSGVFGFVAAYTALLAGIPTLLDPVFKADRVVENMAAVGVTHIVGGDDLVGRIADAQRATGLRLRLRQVLMADFEGRSPELATWAESIGAVLTGVYGSSELFALTAFWPTNTPADLRGVGGGAVVSPAIEVRVADPTDDAVLGAGAEGELQFRGPNVVDAYLGDDTAMSRSVTADGWFRSGDLGTLVGPGKFRYVCRAGDALRLRGFLVDPAEIELRLVEHEDVVLAKVVGAPAANGRGSVAVAFVVPRAGRHPSAAALTTWCAATLAKFKVPEEVRFLDEMPTTSGTNGTKIRTAALRELVAAERTTDVH